ncbi:hypothetical protein D3C86_569350 [compost metagenome]
MSDETSNARAGETGLLEDIVHEGVLVIDRDFYGNDETFWDDAETATIQVMGGIDAGYNRFKAEMVYQWYVDGSYIKVRTLRYRMTPPSGYAVKERANINFQAIVRPQEIKRNSQDNLKQDSQWHEYGVTADFYAPTEAELRITIEVDFDGPDGGGWKWSEPVFHAVPVPRITSPVDNAQLSNFAIPVKGTTNSSAAMTVFLFRGQTQIDSVPARISGSEWTAEFSKTYAPGTYRLEVKQKRTHSITLNLILLKPDIDSPANNAVLANSRPVFSGTGAPGATVDIHESGVGTRLGGGFLVRADKQWSGELTTMLNLGREYVTTAIQRFEGGESNNWADDCKIRMLSAPMISSPTSNQVVEMRTLVSGSVNALFKSGTVKVRRDLVGTQLGSATVNASTGGWEASLTVDLIPGPYSLTAVHEFSGVTSIAVTPIALKVRPPRPTLTGSTIKAGGVVEVYGNGYTGARFDLHFDGNQTPYLNAPVVGGTWRVDLPATLVPGNHKFGGQQSVSDGGSGRIFNTGWTGTVLTVNVPTPVPTGTTVTVNGQRPTFSGQGRQWGTNAVKVGIFNNGVALAGVPQADVLSNLSWQTTASADIAPGNYTELTSRQRVNDQWSGDSVKFSMTVASPAPEFTNPPQDTPAGQRPRISGTAWSGSAISLKIPNKPDVPLTATGGIFFLDATEDWAPGTYTLTATAAFGGQTSATASRTFTVGTPLPLISTAANAEVDLSPVIEGTGFRGCWVVIYSNVTHQPIGAGPVGEDNLWEVTSTEQIPGNLAFYAKQQAAQDSSNISAPTTVKTVKVRVPKPEITVPAQNGKPARVSLFSGTGQYPGSVELSIKGQTPPFLKDIDVISDGTWEAKVTLPAGGPITVEARLRQKTYASDPLERVITVVPAMPVHDTPCEGEALGKLLTISGFGFPGDTIRIVRRGIQYANLVTTTVSDSGTWSVSKLHGMREPDEGISVYAFLGTGQDSTWTPIRYFNLLQPAPTITEPLAHDWVGVRPHFSGLATPGARITIASWFNTDEVLATATADHNGRWAVTGYKDLPEGAMRVVVREKMDDKPPSEWMQSGRFMVERKTELDPPTVLHPSVGQQVGRWPMFSGTGEPGAEVLIIKQNSMSTELGRALVARNGQWSLRSKIQLPVATTPYVCSVRQSRDGATSPWLLPHPGFVVTQVASGFERPTIDKPVDNAAEALERIPVFSGRGMPGASLRVRRDNAVHLALTRVDAQGNWTVRSELELAVQAEGYVIDAYQNMDGQQSKRSNLVLFKVEEKLDKPVVTSPAQDALVSPHAVFHGTALPGAEVRLYKSGVPSSVLGRGIADEQGQWVIVTVALPLGAFRIGGAAYRGGVFSGWMTDFRLNVIDGG